MEEEVLKTLFFLSSRNKPAGISTDFLTFYRLLRFHRARPSTALDKNIYELDELADF